MRPLTALERLRVRYYIRLRCAVPSPWLRADGVGPAEGVGTGVVAPGRWGSGVPLSIVHGSARPGAAQVDLQRAGWNGMMTTCGGNSGASSRELPGHSVRRPQSSNAALLRPVLARHRPPP